MTDEEIWEAEERRGDHDDSGCWMRITMHPFGCILFGSVLLFAGYGLFRLFF